MTDWWEKYVYLRGNGELPINSNYYVLDSGFFRPTSQQTSRMAQILYVYLYPSRGRGRKGSGKGAYRKGKRYSPILAPAL